MQDFDVKKRGIEINILYMFLDGKFLNLLRYIYQTNMGIYEYHICFKFPMAKKSTFLLRGIHLIS